MELSLSLTSHRVPSTTPRPQPLFLGFSKHFHSIGLLHHTHRWCSNPIPKRPRRPGSIRACTGVGAAGSDRPFADKSLDLKDACWRFLRPHTIRRTTLGSFALVARALIENSNLIKWSLLFKAFYGLFALICRNGYTVGINQIYNISIDNVNKPYLPIVAGDLSVRSAWFLVIFFAVAGLSIVGLNFVRGFLLNFGVYYATKAALGLTFEWSSPVVFITTFVTFFALVISITKDLPDVEGDRKYQISTFATKLGVRNIAFLGSGILLMNYIVSILAVIYMLEAFRRWLLILAHTIFALSLINQVC
uniref:Digeranylgeranylglyceryl phosphate synthase n=1 Tax=Cajanus cajan TaxID=3821 RepID=A0A151U3V9_CAJCA|nr:Digeranylgeranylglyceryl phosphate synthase [Cajanus cajan]